MEKFMESKFMQGFMIVAAKLGAQKHLVAIRDGFTAIMPIIIAGSLTVVINNLPTNGDGKPLKEILAKNEFLSHLILDLNGTVWWGTLGTMSLFLVVSVGYAIARGYEQDAIAAGICALCVFLSIVPQAVSGMHTEDTVMVPGIVQRHIAGQTTEGFTVAEDPKTAVETGRTVNGVKETKDMITSYTVTNEAAAAAKAAAIAAAGTDADKKAAAEAMVVAEKVTVTYAASYELIPEGQKNAGKPKVDADGQPIFQGFDAGTLKFVKETGTWGVINWAYTNTAGLFVAMIIGLCSGDLFSRLAKSGKISIRMPESVPPAVASSFASLIPGLVTIFGLVTVINYIVLWTKEPMEIDSFFALVNKLISEPIKGISEGYGAAVVVACLTTFLWFFGLHGANIVGAVFEPISLAKITENSNAVNNGKDPENIVTTGFLNTYLWMGGSGCTLALLFAIYIGSKSKAQKAVASLALVPGIFEINEPVIFGLPIVLNPAYFVPFILVPFVLTTTTYFATVAGICPVVSVLAPWTLPPIISGYLSTNGNVMACVFQVINLVMATLIYLPFVKIADAMEAKSQEA